MGHTPAMQPDAIRHGFADVNGVRLHYASTGACADTEARKLIIFLHGFPEFWYAWRGQLAEFGRDYLAVAPDMRGYNLSSKPAEVAEYDMARLVGDVRALVGYFGAERCYLVGHDWGGVVAWGAAIALPEAIEKLVIINAPHPGVFARELKENPAQQQASQYMVMFRSPQAEAIISANNFANFQHVLLDDLIKEGLMNEADRRAYLEAWSQPGAITGGLNYYRAAQAGPPDASLAEAFDATKRLPALEVKVPTLVIWGEKDPYLLPGNLNGLDRYVSNLMIERIADATHWVVHEKPAQVNSLIRRFLTR